MSTSAWRPIVSVVVPMLNELGFIEACLGGFAAQTYPLDLLDVIVVDGGSTDGCRPVADSWAAREAWVRVIDNFRRKASAAFNCGVEAAKGDVVCLFSAHGVPDPEYIACSVAVLDETGAAGVGGKYLHIGLDPNSNAIGLAMVSPFGMASSHRFAVARREVDTISHPAYRKDALLDVGGFDETLERNSDYELNWRLRERGNTLVFDPSVSSIYRPRPSLRALARQFWWYGRWKERVVRSHPGSLQPRHLVAPTAVVFALLAPLLGATRPGRKLIVGATTAYAALLVSAVVAAKPRERNANMSVLAAAFPVIHGAWGAGFLASVVEDLVGRG